MTVVSLRELVNPSQRQGQFLEAVKGHLFVLYGGAGGGGKSYIMRWTLVALLLKWAKEGLCGVTVGLFCEDYPALNDRHLSKIRREFPAWLGRLKEQAKEFHLHPRFGGGVIAFRNLDDPSKYASVEFAAIAVDEITKNERQTFDDLRWRRRWPGIARCPFIAATNPGGVGHSWVKKLWVDRDFSDEPGALDPQEFAFIRARAEDNPHLSPEYLTELDSLPEAMRRAVRDGSWDIFAGQAFSEWRREIHVCQPFAIPAWWRRWRANDRGYGEPAVWYWYAASPEGQVYVYREWVCTQVRPSEQARTVVQQSTVGSEVPPHQPEMEPVLDDYGQPVMDAEGHPAMQPVQERVDFTSCPDDVNTADPERGKSWADLYRDGGISGLVIVRRDPDVRAALVHEYLAPIPDPLIEGATTARLRVFSTCTYLIRTLPTLPVDPDRPNRVESGGEDHGFDALGHGLQAWHAARSKPPVAPAGPVASAKAKLMKSLQAQRRRAQLN